MRRVRCEGGERRAGEGIALDTERAGEVRGRAVPGSLGGVRCASAARGKRKGANRRVSLMRFSVRRFSGHGVAVTLVGSYGVFSY